MQASAIFLCVAALLGQPDAKPPLLSWDNELHAKVCLTSSRHAYACTIGKHVIMPEFASLDSPRWRAILAHEYAHALGYGEDGAQWVELNSNCS